MLTFLRTTLVPFAVLVAAGWLALAGDAQPDVSWLASTSLARGADGGGDLRLASAPSGHAVMAWTGKGARGRAVVAALRPPARPFGAPTVVSVAGRVMKPRVAIDSHGDAVAAWTHRTADASVLEAALRDGGGAFAAPVRFDARAIGDVAVAVAGDRRVLVGWTIRSRSRQRRLMLAWSRDRRGFDRAAEVARAPDLRLLGARAGAEAVVLLVRRHGRIAVETVSRGGARRAFLLPSRAADATLATDGGQVAAAAWTVDGVVQAATGRLDGVWRPAMTIGPGRTPRIAVRPDRSVMVTSSDAHGLRAVTVSGPEPWVRQVAYPFGRCAGRAAAVEADRGGAFHLVASCRIAVAAEALAVTTRMPRGEWAQTTVLARDGLGSARLAATSKAAAIAAWRQRGEVRVAFRNVASASGALMLFP